LHPHTKQTDASAIGRIRLPLKNDIALERISYLSIVVSADRPRESHSPGVPLGTRLGRAGPYRAHIDESMLTTGQAGIGSDRDWTSAMCSRVAAWRSS
jgi:hypothetical protein